MPTPGVLDARQQRGLAIVAKDHAKLQRVHQYEWRVPSQTEGGPIYRVRLPGGGGSRTHWRCTCPDFVNRTLDCKHIWAVRFVLAVQAPVPVALPVPAPVAKGPSEEIARGMACKHCGSAAVTRYGKNGKKPAYWCKPCGRKFVVDEGFKRLRNDPKVVTLALDLYFKGVSLRQITDTLEQFFSVGVSHVAVYNWLNRYVGLLNEYAATLKPTVGTAKWHADEMKVKYGADWRWLWHVMDRDTRYLLVSKVTGSRDLADARGVFQAAKDKADGETPAVIVTDGLPAYMDAAKKVYGAGTKREARHEREIHLTSHSRNNNMVERLNGTVRGRHKNVRGLKSEDGPMTQGQAAYYNLVRPHSALDGETPANAAGLRTGSVDGNRWLWLIGKATNQNETGAKANDRQPPT